VFLKTLSIKGFKSFADSTRLDLEPGITVIVGPNGSGKSNVVDAIGWVLGAQAPSIVRSQKMDDVIFAGTAKRPALGRAEVGLTIDNSAGLLPIDFTEVTISRTLFRDGDSEYAINGVSCRLLDVQELLSDTGVGRQQHVIVSQGQIDAVLNSRPEDRRLIIEEAAGVLKYRRRREKSQRRLAATEGNLTRITDLLREVRRQLRPLERQADAARRHAGVVAELTALRIFLAGRELTTLTTRMERIAQQRHDIATEERDLKGRLATLDADVLAAEARLGGMGGGELNDDLVRFESLRERCRGLAALLVERQRGIERERSAFVDQGVIFSLESEAARLRTELDEITTAQTALGPERDELTRSEAALAEARASFEASWGGVDIEPQAGAAEARGELVALRGGLERDEREQGRMRARLSALDERTGALDERAVALQRDLEDIESGEAAAVSALEAAEGRRMAAEQDMANADARRRRADADLHTWTARADALAGALAGARAKAGAERLSSLEGVLGSLLDLVEIEEGWEAAVEAAAGDALAAVVVDGSASAKRAVGSLRDGDGSGVLLVPGALPPAMPPPPVGQPVRAAVRGTSPAVDQLLDALLGGAVRVQGGWPEAIDAALAHPGSVVVTGDGDRFGPGGWQVGAGGAGGATAAAVEDAQRRAAQAGEEVAAAEDVLAAARATLDDARRAEQAAVRGLTDADARRGACAEALQRVESDRADGRTEAEGLRTHLVEIEERAARDRARAAELDAQLPALEADDEATATKGRSLHQARGTLEEQSASVSALRTDLEVRAANLLGVRQELERRLAELDERLGRDAAERATVEARRLDLDARSTALERLAGVVAATAADVDTALADLRRRRQEQSDAVRTETAKLDGLRRERVEAEKALQELRERGHRVEVEEAEARLRLETLTESARRELDIEPETAMATECPELPEGATPAARARDLERDLRLMGPVNPLALEEYEALQERHTFLEAQLDDVRSSRRDLSKVIKSIDDEIVRVFAAAYADVAENFEALFSTLFPGGKGGLKLTDPDNLLETGVEVEARPSGKNVKKLSLLSGGERSLTALAFLFAVFRARPSPFYVLDEVEAALDDVNLHRFLDLLHEFRSDAQLLVVSHQKRTMEAGDCLYGVTMEPGGSSRVLSEKVGSTDEHVA
jgi:chromosome segregation protein